MSQFQTAAQLNNEGVNALLNGDQAMAMSCMGKAIKLMREALVIASAAPDEEMIKNSIHHPDTNIVTPCSHQSVQQNADTIEIPCMESSTDTIIFNQAFRIPTSYLSVSNNHDATTTTTTIEMSDVMELNIYTSAIVFNYALAHHLMATSSPSSSPSLEGSGDVTPCCSTTSMLDKTEKLYSAVLKLLGGAEGNDEILQVSHTALVVKLACINNLSQIRYVKGDYKNAREGFKQMTRFVKRSLVSNKEMLEEPKVRSLLMNVLLVLGDPIVAAAA